MLEYAAMMRLVFACALLLALLCRPATAQVEPSVEPGLTLKAYLIYDVTTERVVAELNRKHEQPVASLTKLMTAVLTCERLRFDGRYVLTEAEQKTFGVTTMRADKMLELMLVPSNNSICRLVARIACGGEEAFAAQMNAKARQLGLADTRYVNSTGLPGQGQYSTLDDLLLLTRVALTYPRIRRVIGKDEITLAGRKYEGTLKPLYDRHPALVGGKTGYTRAAGRCLVLLYSAGGHDYIVVTLGSKDVDAGFRDAEILLKQHGLYSGEVGSWE
jgi:D-alanyl-D-alanine carboxypeptidase (penicillin-binding protein 5/6)